MTTFLQALTSGLTQVLKCSLNEPNTHSTYNHSYYYNRNVDSQLPFRITFDSAPESNSFQFGSRLLQLIRVSSIGFQLIWISASSVDPPELSLLTQHDATQRQTGSMSHNHGDVGMQLDEDKALVACDDEDETSQSSPS